MRAWAAIAIVAGTASCAHQRHPYAFSFVPFGVGQLENGEPRKALAFALTEAAAAATSAGIWLHLEERYPAGRVPAADAVHVRRLEQIEIGTGVAFLGLATWGVIDAVVHWRPSVEVMPAPIAGGAGLAVSGRF